MCKVKHIEYVTHSIVSGDAKTPRAKVKRVNVYNSLDIRKIKDVNGRFIYKRYGGEYYYHRLNHQPCYYYDRDSHMVGGEIVEDDNLLANFSSFPSVKDDNILSNFSGYDGSSFREMFGWMRIASRGTVNVKNEDTGKVQKYTSSDLLSLALNGVKWPFVLGLVEMVNVNSYTTNNAKTCRQLENLTDWIECYTDKNRKVLSLYSYQNTIDKILNKNGRCLLTLTKDATGKWRTREGRVHIKSNPYPKASVPKDHEEWHIERRIPADSPCFDKLNTAKREAVKYFFANELVYIPTDQKTLDYEYNHQEILCGYEYEVRNKIPLFKHSCFQKKKLEDGSTVYSYLGRGWYRLTRRGENAKYQAIANWGINKELNKKGVLKLALTGSSWPLTLKLVERVIINES